MGGEWRGVEGCMMTTVTHQFLHPSQDIGNGVFQPHNGPVVRYSCLPGALRCEDGLEAMEVIGEGEANENPSDCWEEMETVGLLGPVTMLVVGTGLSVMVEVCGWLGGDVCMG
jgi:hypothetical protein